MSDGNFTKTPNKGVKIFGLFGNVPKRGGKMKFSKLMAYVTLATSATMLLTACSSDKAGGGKTTIEFMTTSTEKERQDNINKMIEKFESENKNIDVKLVPVEEDALNTKVVTLARAKKLPAVIEVFQDYAKVMDQQELTDNKSASEVIKKVGEDSYYTGALKLVRNESGNEFIAAPISGWVQGIWYNKTLLEKEGFGAPETWEDIIKIAKQFTDTGHKKYGIALPTVDGTFSEQAFSQFALSNGANVLDKNGKVTIDTKEMQEALAYYKELYKYALPGSNDTTEVNDAFMNGTAPMAMYSTYILPGAFEANKASEIGFAVPKKEDSAVYGTVSALSITNGLDDSEKEAAKKFVEYMSEPKQVESWTLMSPMGAQPVNKKVVDSETYKSNETVKAYGDLSTTIAESFDKVQVFGLVGDKNYKSMGTITSSGAIGKAVYQVTVKDGNVQEALKAAQKAAETAE